MTNVVASLDTHMKDLDKTTLETIRYRMTGEARRLVHDLRDNAKT